MTDVKIRAKGCAATGITDELANKMYNAKGSRHLAIVELKVERTSEDADGDRAVELTIQEVEPVVDGKLNGALDEHVRTIQQALYRNRALADGQEQLEYGDGPEPSVSEVIAAGKAFVETDESGEVTGLWDGDTDDDAIETPEESEAIVHANLQAKGSEGLSESDDDDHPDDAGNVRTLTFSGKDHQ